MAVSENQNEFLAVHEDVVKRVLERQPAEEELYDLAELFKVFGRDRVVCRGYGADS